MLNYKYIDLVFDNINFKEGYGSSNNFLGYCERNKKLTINRVNKIIDLFLDQFKSSISKSIVITSLVKTEDVNNICDKKNSKHLFAIEKHLLDSSYIKTKNINYYWRDLNQKDFYDSFNILTNVDSNMIKYFATLQMMDDNIDGHCFFLFEELDFISYAHEDTGFGFINISSKNKNEIVYSFLDIVKNQEDFDATIKQ